MNPGVDLGSWWYGDGPFMAVLVGCGIICIVLWRASRYKGD